MPKDGRLIRRYLRNEKRARSKQQTFSWANNNRVPSKDRKRLMFFRGWMFVHFVPRRHIYIYQQNRRRKRSMRKRGTKDVEESARFRLIKNCSLVISNVNGSFCLLRLSRARALISRRSRATLRFRCETRAGRTGRLINTANCASG